MTNREHVLDPRLVTDRALAERYGAPVTRTRGPATPTEPLRQQVDRRPLQLGVNLPWVDFGNDFGIHPWRDQHWTPEWVHRELDEFTRMDLKVVRWFILADGRSLVWRRTQAGALPTLVGLTPRFVEDFAALVATFARHPSGIKLLPVLTSSSLFDPPARITDLEPDTYVAGGTGRALLASANGTRFVQLLQDLVRAAQPYQDVISMWELCNEPDGAVEHGRVALPALRALLMRSATGVSAAGARQPLTIGWKSAVNVSTRWRIPGLVPQLHHYGTDGTATPPRAPSGNAFIGEVGTSRTPPGWAASRPFSENAFLLQPLGTKLNRLAAAGWHKILLWSKYSGSDRNRDGLGDGDTSSDWEEVRDLLLRTRPAMQPRRAATAPKR